MRKVAIIGPNGQLGTDLVKAFSNKGWGVIPLPHGDIEVTDIDSVSKALQQIEFEYVINTAAFHKVDECEKDTEKAWLVNAKGQQNITLVANDLGSKSVYISSDYVFNGEKKTPYDVGDPVSPINAYGHSKSAGELTTLSCNSGNVVMRISSVFGSAGSSGKGGNFIETILNKAKAGNELKVVCDIQMSPTYTVDAAKTLESALSNNFTGLIHGANSGSASWFELAKFTLDTAGVSANISETETDWSNSVKRPRYSVLETSQTQKYFKSVESWESAVKRYLFEKGHIS